MSLAVSTSQLTGAKWDPFYDIGGAVKFFGQPAATSARCVRKQVFT